ncbi:MAG: hypothetical protein H6R26_2647, partial [Proteobacteria bacterium]|nr:hypothetical protein [Pseudomonadota bacterium]
MRTSSLRVVQRQPSGLPLTCRLDRVDGLAILERIAPCLAVGPNVLLIGPIARYS